MDLERRAQLAKGLANNPLLAELFDARAADIHEQWEAESSAEARERLWLELKATNDIRDFINARIDSYRRGPD